MKTKELLDTIQKVIPAVDSKSVVAQTNHLIFSNGLISAYNGKIAISTPIDLDIECSVPAEDMLKIIKSVDDKNVGLSVEDNLLHISSKDMRATISTEVEEEAALEAISNFDLDDLFNEKGAEIPDNFIYGLGLCASSASKNADDVHNLNCILVNSTSMHAGDGYRATIFDLTHGMPNDLLIPLSSAVQLIKFDPETYTITSGWMHLMDKEDTVFSLRVVEGDFPDIHNVLNGFSPDISITLPDNMTEIAESLGNIAESPVENFKVLEIEITGEIISFHVEKSGVYATKTLEFPGNDTDASFLISATMLSSILETTSDMELNNKFALFTGKEFQHIIALVEK